MKRRSGLFVTALAALGATVLTACSGGSSDTVGGGESSGDGSGGTINL
ncbi:MAG: sulfate ABC transporter substrate-binding protein, partial [Rhodococcus sp. (in: high G+C Gram-positive bacteria)]|nr:sulfate ABC transporter substrate-binding protein [Rhodococcus sp. (in: high G+C Gram-positive bacteria)]MDX5454949.1 sulfate ABC transporter substrate-binding protein [Rhodococcus sp. (in: high G+C Gram-positive bacteria)]